MSTPYTISGSIYDDFRPVVAGTAINGRTSDSGQMWVDPGFGGTWQTQNVGSAEGNIASSITTQGYVRVGLPFGTADVTVEAVLHAPNTGGSAGLSVRNAGNAFYAVAVSYPDVAVIKVTNALSGTATSIADWTGLGAQMFDGCYIGAVCSGSTISAYLNGVLIGSVVDSGITGTNHGIYQRFGNHAAGAGGDIYAFGMHPVFNKSRVGMVL